MLFRSEDGDGDGAGLGGGVDGDSGGGMEKTSGGDSGGVSDASGRRIDANRATRAKLAGPTRPGTVAAWDPPFWSSGLHSLTSFAPKSSHSKIMTSLNL